MCSRKIAVGTEAVKPRYNGAHGQLYDLRHVIHETVNSTFCWKMAVDCLYFKFGGGGVGQALFLRKSDSGRRSQP